MSGEEKKADAEVVKAGHIVKHLKSKKKLGRPRKKHWMQTARGRAILSQRSKEIWQRRKLAKMKVAS